MKKYIIALALIFPSVVFAQLGGIGEIISGVGSLITPLIRVTVALALLVFIWGLVKFIFRVGGDEKAVDDGKRLMIWGLIALFVMISVWGIVGFMQDALSLPNSSTPPANIPQAGLQDA